MTTTRLLDICTTEQFGPPMELQHTSVTKNSISFQWRSPHANNSNNVMFEYYNINVYSNESGHWRKVHFEIHRGNSRQLGSLHPNYHYRVEVSAISSNGYEPGPPNIQYVQTREDGISEVNILLPLMHLTLYPIIIGAILSVFMPLL